ncbi:MAG: NADP oxidoreductase [Fluviicola sp.]|nr:MAG: NADP oxidoreductase [Fluviicola sp.]
MKEIKRISIVGTGNVAHHLGRALKKNNFQIDGVWGRTKKNALQLADDLKTISFENINDIPKSTDLIMICVSDSAIEEIVDTIPNHLPIAYTSGSVSLESFPKKDKIGVFYPLQTFTKSRDISFDSIPLLIESGNEEFANSLRNCANELSETVRFTSSAERFQIHIAAVMVNNFTNHLYHLADLHMKNHHLPFAILKPLILETAEKVQDVTPSMAQTGPAKRKDSKIIEKHLSELDSQTKEIYQMLSKSIINHNTK